MNKYLRVLVSSALLVWLAWRADWSQISAAFAQIRVWFWAVAFGMYLLAQWISAVRWRLLAKTLGFERPLSAYLRLYFVGMFFNLFLPTSIGGDVARAWYLDKGSGRRMAAFVSVFSDRFNGLVVLIALACLAAAFCPIPLPFWVLASVWGTGVCTVSGLACIPLAGKYAGGSARLQRAAQGIQFLARNMRLVTKCTLLSIAVQAANVILVWLLGRALHLDIPPAYYWVFVPMVAILTLLPVSLNGMGVREGGMVLFLAPLGIGDSAALCLSFLWFSIFTAASLLGGIAYLWGGLPRPEVLHYDETVDHRADQGRTGQLTAAA